MLSFLASLRKPPIIITNKAKELFSAAKVGNIEKLQDVLNSGAKLDMKNSEGKTILHVAAEKEDVKMLKYILDRFPKDDKHASAFFSAHELTENPEIKLLLANAIFLQGAKQGYLEIVKKSLAIGADKNCVDEYGNTGLHKAAYACHVKIVQYLLEQGCLIKKNNKQKTPAEMTSSEAIQQLLIQTALKEKDQIFSDLSKTLNYDGIIKLAEALKTKQWDTVLQIYSEYNNTNREQNNETIKPRITN